MIRVSRNEDPVAYEQTGKRLAGILLAAVTEYAQRPVRDLLDWGCGPGRIAAPLVVAGLSLYGCDVDAEAVAWAGEHLRGDFTVTGLQYELPYQDCSFDAIVAMSVFTHLTRRRQRLWLRELARVLRPGGVLAASVHGQAVADAYGKEMAPIQDHFLNFDLAGVVPDGYYVNVLQSQAYTREAWSDHFDVVAWEEAALDLHDLVVCIRKENP